MEIKMADDIIKLLEYLFAKMGIAIDWSADNVMPYLEELGNHIVMYKMWSAIVMIGIMIVSLAAAWMICNILTKTFGTESDVNLFILVIRMLAVIAVITTIAFQCVTIVKCKTFPEIVIYDYISDKLNNNSN